ncbi:MAG TPA: hypothetical protein VKT25_10685, partial [Ktedonobacteraceae bacterium]|nr:hypothetical protein [Ktedonobacteraceae bacterium]
LLTISGAKGTLVSGKIHPVESWIVTDTTTFDGLSTPVRVRVDSTRLPGSTHFTGAIMIQPDDSEREIPVTVELDVLGYTTSTITSRPPSGTSRAGTAASSLDDDDDDLSATAATGAGGMRMASQSAVSSGNQPFTNARYDEYRAKYGAPGSGGWDMLRASARQLSLMRHAVTFFASLMSGAFFYLLLAHIPPMVKTSVLPPSPWFIVVLVGILLCSTLGAILVNLDTMWANRAFLTRGGTGLACALTLLGLGEAGWQSSSLGAPGAQLFVMLLLAAAGVTLGVAPRVSDQIIKSSMWLMTRMVWVMYLVAVVVGGALGYGLTSGISFGCFSPFAALFGAGVGVALVLRIRRLLLRQRQNPPAPTP